MRHSDAEEREATPEDGLRPILQLRPSQPWFGPHRPRVRRLARPVLDFLRVEAASGIVLVVAAVVGLAWANSPWRASYESFWSTEIALRAGPFALTEDLRHWVNDALMVLFFFVVGLEIKHELTEGELREPRRAALPVAAAVGGMIIPACIYLAVNLGGGSSQGWGVAVATDIAFALGVVALLGPRVPPALKVFLLVLAIVDDIGAVVVIAVFYTDDLSFPWLATAVVLLAGVAALRWLRVWYLPVYGLMGVAVWLAAFESGIHATVAGVALGLLAPVRPLLTRHEAEALARQDAGGDPIEEAREASFLIRESVPVVQRVQHALHPWTSYVVIPVFALANAGVSLSGDALADALGSRITIGIVLGLVVGKPLGITVAAWLAMRLGGSLPAATSLRHVAAVGAVAGIGFTMSLFVAGLAFDEGGAFEEAKIGILAASLLASTGGGLWLWRSAGGHDEPQETVEGA